MPGKCAVELFYEIKLDSQGRPDICFSVDLYRLNPRGVYTVRRFFACTIAALIFLTQISLPAYSQDFIRLSGLIKPPTGSELKDARVVVNNGEFTVVAQSGSYQLVVPKDQTLEVAFVLHHAPISSLDATTVWTFSNWRTKLKFSKDTTLDFQMPETKVLRLVFADASGNSLPVIGLEENNLNQPHLGSTQGGATWTGIQRIARPSLDTGAVTRTSSLAAAVFPTKKHDGFAYRGMSDGGLGLETPQQYSGTFAIEQDITLKLCIPVRFGADLTMPKDCFPTASQQKAAVPSPSIDFQWQGKHLVSRFQNIPKMKPVTLKVGQIWLPRITNRATSFTYKRVVPASENLLFIVDGVAVSANTIPTQYSTCAEVWKYFDGGISRTEKSVNKGAKTKKKPTTFKIAYDSNKSLDRDKDGLVCER